MIKMCLFVSNRKSVDDNTRSHSHVEDPTENLQKAQDIQVEEICNDKIMKWLNTVCSYVPTCTHMFLVPSKQTQ